MAVLAGFAGARQGGAAEGGRAALLIACIVVPIALLMAYQVRRGRWENADASNRHERGVLYAVASLAVASILIVLVTRVPQSYMVRGTLIAFVLLAVCAAANWRVKVSLHVAFAVYCAAALLAMRASAGWVALGALPLIAWSRLALARHTVLEVAAGSAIGLAAAAALVFL